MSVSASPSAVSLRRSALGGLAAAVSVPSYDARQLRPGVVHVGVGRFHRAHQATYFDRLAETGVSADWGVVGAGVRSRTTCRALAAQDHLFTVVEAARGGLSARVVGCLRDYLCAPADTDALLALLSGPDVHLVTLTVTAEAYVAAPVPVAVPAPVPAPVADPDAAMSAFDLLVRALELRRRSGARPFTVVSCDNVADNGAATARALMAAADRRDPRGGLSAWVARNVACPATVVDRITPPAGSLGSTLVETFGLNDPCAVVAEEYSAWVVEDRFSSDRPPLEEVGVRFVADVQPWAHAKMRLLNGGHCAVGYLGSAAGYRTSAEAMADPAIATYVAELLREEVVPTLTPLPGLGLDDYADAALRRIADPSLADPLTRLSRRGSVRLPTYVVPSLREALRCGRSSRRLTLLVAAWVHHLRTLGMAAEEALAAELVPLARVAHADSRPLLRRTPGMADLAEHDRFTVVLERDVAALESHGVAGALRLTEHRPRGLTVVEVDAAAS